MYGADGFVRGWFAVVRGRSGDLHRFNNTLHQARSGGSTGGRRFHGLLVAVILARAVRLPTAALRRWSCGAACRRLLLTTVRLLVLVRRRLNGLRLASLDNHGAACFGGGHEERLSVDNLEAPDIEIDHDGGGAFDGTSDGLENYF